MAKTVKSQDKAAGSPAAWYSIRYFNGETEIYKAVNLRAALDYAYKTAKEKKTIVYKVKECNKPNK